MLFTYRIKGFLERFHPDALPLKFETERDEENPRLWRITARVPADEARPIIASAVQMRTDVEGEGLIPMMCVIRVGKLDKAGSPR